MTDLRLVILDVDGTLIDSQDHIVSSMEVAFAANALTPPPRDRIRSVVGLSLPVAMGVLATDHPDRADALVEAYKHAFSTLRDRFDGMVLSPLFPGVRATLDALVADDCTLLAVATGKSRRGMDHILDLHGLRGVLASVQVADDHASKPHPSMIEACLRETGIDRARAVMLGDTSFDMEMARNAGVAALGVSWGYHPIDRLRAAGAIDVLDRFSDLPAALDRICPAS
ncbi:HAD-IA family hydrolase [Roseicyclus persicicus]|uniref:HAD-IA family hydrolase n=1 Tax=Roseicyclus persicicus TaxID=2650661 RepID=A0A7X6H258_9RHOB|nr:HAD-IA family hydrolase [Roseibacterium persicicum]NKX45382.1 HAD-IA family hydrolase [Roseibacterium persicicum]